MDSKIILLVEDSVSDIELTKRALGKAHITNRVVVAEDGKEALEYVFGTGPYAGRDDMQLP
jgi:two-component system response regulator